MACTIPSGVKFDGDGKIWCHAGLNGYWGRDLGRHMDNQQDPKAVLRGEALAQEAPLVSAEMAEGAPTNPVMRVGAPIRQSQAQRSAAMKHRLLEAVLDSLADLGYAKTSTTQIARRANVTRGAQVHHFQTKHQMMTAAVDHIFTLIGEESRHSLSRDLPRQDRQSRLFDLLQHRIFSGRLFVASLELMAAARTDNDLAAILRPQIDRWMTVYAGAVRRYLGLPRRKNEDVLTLLRMTAALMRGFAVEAPLQHQNDQTTALFREWVQLSTPLLADHR